MELRPIHSKAKFGTCKSLHTVRGTASVLSRNCFVCFSSWLELILGQEDPDSETMFLSRQIPESWDLLQHLLACCPECQECWGSVADHWVAQGWRACCLCRAMWSALDRPQCHSSWTAHSCSHPGPSIAAVVSGLWGWLYNCFANTYTQFQAQKWSNSNVNGINFWKLHRLLPHKEHDRTG